MAGNFTKTIVAPKGLPKGLLRVLTCGSVDDGKSSLIGRLLFDTGQVPEDQLLSLDSNGAAERNLADLLDGLAAEREQGITIDVAYRYFNTENRKFILADAPGHEEFTRNMATGASTSDIAILLVDARHGLQIQTRRHAFIASLFGIRHLVLAINKMDMADFSQQAFNQIEVEFRSFATVLGFQDIQCIPISAKLGDNVARTSQNMPWYRGAHLLSYLESVEVTSATDQQGFRFPVQAVNRPGANLKTSERSYAGNVCGGTVKLGETVTVLPAKQTARIQRIVTMDDDLKSARAGQAVNLVLDADIEVSRGSVMCTQSSSDQELPEVSDQVQAQILWMGKGQLFPGRTYLLKTGNATVSASVTELKYKVDVHDLSQHSAKTLSVNEVGVCNLSTGKPIVFEPYDRNRTLGSFILIDRQNNETVAAGMIKFSLRRASNIKWQELEVDKEQRAIQKHQKPAVLWFTGLSGSGKSTIASLVEKKLFDLGKHTYTLDGDNVRHGLNKDLGFTDADRIENIRRISETARLMADAGLVVLVSFISPFTAERQMARKLMDEGEFIEIHVNTPLEVAEQRDVKGLYAKARAGEIKNFTGIDSAYQPPKNAEITVDTVDFSPEQSANRIIKYLTKNGYINGDI